MPPSLLGPEGIIRWVRIGVNLDDFHEPLEKLVLHWGECAVRLACPGNRGFDRRCTPICHFLFMYELLFAYAAGVQDLMCSIEILLFHPNITRAPDASPATSTTPLLH